LNQAADVTLGCADLSVIATHALTLHANGK
jgi:hypothetical protein